MYLKFLHSLTQEKCVESTISIQPYLTLYCIATPSCLSLVLHEYTKQLYSTGMAYPMCDPYLQNWGKANCWPISLRNILFNVLERIVYNMCTNKLIKHQFGFLQHCNNCYYYWNLFGAKLEANVVYVNISTWT